MELSCLEACEPQIGRSQEVPKLLHAQPSRLLRVRPGEHRHEMLLQLVRLPRLRGVVTRGSRSDARREGWKALGLGNYRKFAIRSKGR